MAACTLVRPLICARCASSRYAKNMEGRPIALVDTLRMLVATWLLATSRGRGFAAVLAPLQTAFAQGSPCEVMAMGEQA